MNARLSATLGIAAGLLFASLAPAAAADYYLAPKLLHLGTATTGLAGPGTVIVKVLVKADGSFTVNGIISSTNHGDDAAALEIAKSSKYSPAHRGAKAVLAFYDFTLKFTGTSVSSGNEAGELGTYERMIRAGNFAGAKTHLEAYLQAHPGDQHAELALGEADTELRDFTAAAAAYDAAGTIPATDRDEAIKAYVNNITAQLQAKNPDAAVASAKRAVELSPTYVTHNALGFAQLQSGQASAAVASLQTALKMAASLAPSKRAPIESNLAAAFAANDQLDQAQAEAARAVADDPKATGGKVAIANAFAKQARAKTAAGDQMAAAALYEQAAQVTPSAAATMYTNAAIAYLGAKPNPANDKAKAAADKALALAPDDPTANFAAGVALANQGKRDAALVYLKKADSAATTAGNTDLASQIESAIKQMSR